VWDDESGALHRELEGCKDFRLTAMTSFLSADGQQARLVVGSDGGDVMVYDPEAGSLLPNSRHRHGRKIAGLACIASSSAAPHHPRLQGMA
jgi:hypothetical protein